jgi:hypothetical protein
MKRITIEKAIELSKKCDKFVADANPFYLATNCFSEIRNGEEIILDKDVTDNKIKPLFLPKKKENMAGQSISYGFEEDINLLSKLGFEIRKKELFGYEYIYRTKDFVSLEGQNFKSFRKAINKFKKTYDYKILADYPRERIIRFLKSWIKQKTANNESEMTKRSREAELELDTQWIDLFDKIPNKRIFIEIDGKLAGFAVFLELYSNLWVALMQKTNYQYGGMTKFLYHLKAEQMKDIEFFSTGNLGDDGGLIEYKESMHPVRKIPVHVLEIGDNKS